MGISINIAIQLAKLAPLVKDCNHGVMLGRQKMHFRPKEWTPRLIEALSGLGIEATSDDLFQKDQFCESFLKTIGWPRMESLDFSAIEGAEHIHDLSTPVGPDLTDRFDLVYDGGTTEHVFDIAQAFRNVDAMLKTEGIFISCVGANGWFGHGFYQIGPDIPWRYWVASLGYEMLGCWTLTRDDPEPPSEIPDPTGVSGGATQRFRKPRFLFYAVRKKPRQGPPKPVIQSHYVDY